MAQTVMVYVLAFNTMCLYNDMVQNDTAPSGSVLKVIHLF